MMRIYLFRGAHPLYETLISDPPEGVEYLPIRDGEGAEDYTLYGSRHSFLRSNVNKMFEMTGMPRILPVMKKYDLVHSSRGFFIFGPNRYVVDIEHVSSFAGMRHARMTSSRFRRLVEKGLNSRKCVHILPHCEKARQTLSIVTDSSSILDKTTVLYPAVKAQPLQPRKGDATPNLFFYGEYYWKGGREFLRACMRLSSKYDFKVTYVSLRVHPPSDVVSKAKESLDIDYFEGPVPRRTLLSDLYPRADVFVMPTNIDTFGYAFLEAMSFGLPCIGTDHFAVPEIIEDGKTGFIVHAPHSCFDSSGRRHASLSIETANSDQTVDQLCDRMEQLIRSASLRNEMGMNARNCIESGKFSIQRRNSILKDVYEGSMRA